MKEIRTKSTSRATAQASDIVLRDQTTTRLIFRPTMVDNPNNPTAAVKGTFLYQRKTKKSEWEDFGTISLTSVKSGEGYKLELKSAELLLLMQELRPLYGLIAQEGIPRGKRRYVQSTPQIEALERLSSIAPHEVSNYFNANVALGTALTSQLLTWVTELDNPASIIETLVATNPESLAKLNAAIGLHRLKEALKSWEQNQDNSNEEFWQQSLAEHSHVLEQVFSWPTSIVDGKAYIGGKNVFNKSGNIVDFLLRAQLTNSAALIEIKTPMSKLLGGKYRGTFNVSTELMGSVMQTLNYKHSLQENYQSVAQGNTDLFASFNPQCAVIIGNAQTELDHQTKTKAFELYRHQFPGLVVITFDELFEKTRQLIGLLEGKPVPEVDNDFIPF